MGSADGLGDQGGDGQDADLFCVLNGVSRFDGVGDDELAQLRLFDARKCGARQDAVGDIGGDVNGAIFAQRRGGVAERSGGIDDVVDEDAEAVAHFADDVHDFGLAGFSAALVDDGEVGAEPLGDGARAHDSADIGRDDGDFFLAEALADIAQENGCGEEVVSGDIKEALNLCGVEVDGEYAVGACVGDHIGDEFRGDRGARAGFAILAGIAEIGNDGGDAAGRCAAQRIDDDEQLHDMIVGGVGGGLDDENIGAADVVLDFGEDFHIGEAADIGAREREAELRGDGLGEGARAISRDQFHKVFIYGLVDNAS